MDRHWRAWLGVVFAATVSGALPHVAAQEPKCDPGLENRISGPQAYRRRGDRCEGIYAQPVGGTVLLWASLTESFEDYQPSVAGAPLTVEWSAPSQDSVQLRVVSLRRDLYYRMDANRAATPSVYRWPSDFLASQRIMRRDVGVLAWVRHRFGGTDRIVYLPLRVSQKSPAARNPTYELVLYPTVSLKEVYLTITEMDETGRGTRTLRDGVPLRYGFYPAERPLRIKLPPLGATGFYRIETGAELERGGSVAVAQWVYHVSSPGR